MRTFVFTVLLSLGVGAALAAGSAQPSDHVRERIDAGRYSEAVTLARQLLAEEQSRGSETVRTAQAMILLAEALDLDGKWKDAQGAADRALGTLNRLLGAEHPEFARALSLAGVLRVGENGAIARSMLERALFLQRRSLGADHLEVARTHVRLARLEGSCAERLAATRHVEQALPILEHELDANHPETLLARGSLASPQDPAACIETLGRVLEDFEHAWGPRHPLVAGLMIRLGECRGAAGDFDGWRRNLEEGLALRVATLGPEHPLVMYDLIALGVFHGTLHETDRARASLERALVLATKIYGAESPRLGTLLLWYAWFVGGLVDDGPERASELLRRALDLNSAALGADCPFVIDTMLRLAIMTRDRDPAEAKTMVERALAVLEAREENDSAELASALHYLGEIEATMGDHARARANLERSLAMSERLGGGNQLSLWVVLADLGDVLSRLGDTAGAEAQLLRSSALLERDLGPQHGSIAIVLSLLARVRTEQGNFGDARQLLERALRIADNVFGPESQWTNLVLRNLCALQIAFGDLDRAGPTCERTLAATEKRYGTQHPYYAGALVRQGTVSLARGAAGQALNQALEAEVRARAHFLRTSEELSSREALSFQGVRQSGLDIALSIVARRSATAGDSWRAWNEVVLSRAMVLDEVASRPKLAMSADAETRDLVRKLGAARGKLLRLRSLDSAASVELFDRTIAEIDAAERALAVRHATTRNKNERAAFGLADVVGALPPRTALVAYVRYQRLTSAVPITWTPSYLAFVWTPVALRATVLDLGPADRIDRLIEAWKRELIPPRLPGADPAAEARYRRAGGALREAVWDPIRARLDHVDLSIVVPDGDLHFVNLADLPAPKGGYLIETLPVMHLVSAERDVASLGTPAEPGAGLLLVGGPSFDLAPAEIDEETTAAVSAALPAGGDALVYRGPASSCPSLRSLTFGSLPRSIAEIDSVQSVWQKSARSAEDARVIKLVGARASEGRFKRLAAGPRVVHIATHGFFSGPECRVEQARTARPPAENLLTLAGLAFAGANRRAEAGPDQDDGILTAEEVASLDLRRAEWVVLSACDSGMGKVVDGEGLLGLRRGFQTAGARTLIVSLWPVEDEAARLWMSRLYDARSRGQSTASAVRNAGLDVLRVRRQRGLTTHPVYWGAFVAVGDWR